jgi:hypothetical protein
VENFAFYLYYVVQQVLDEHAALTGCCTPQTETPSTIPHKAEWIALVTSVWR